MENAAGALRMGGAMMLFILAFTLIMNLYNQAKYTMDTILYSIDERNYYHHVGATEANITREVGVDTIIPTLYTYITNSDDSVRINIVNKNNKLVQVFDSKIEGLINQYANSGDENLKNSLLCRRYNTTGTPLNMFGAPWVGDTSASIDRINAYVYGDKRYIKNSQVQVDYLENNLLKLGNKFEENYVEYQSTGRIFWSEDYQESLVVTEGAMKTVITYKQK